MLGLCDLLPLLSKIMQIDFFLSERECYYFINIYKPWKFASILLPHHEMHNMYLLNLKVNKMQLTTHLYLFLFFFLVIISPTDIDSSLLKIFHSSAVATTHCNIRIESKISISLLEESFLAVILPVAWIFPPRLRQTNLFIENNLFNSSPQHVFHVTCCRSECGMKYLSNQREPEVSLGYTLVIMLAMH